MPIPIKPPDDGLVEQHCADLQHADLALVFHPNWWRLPPAIHKGWIGLCGVQQVQRRVFGPLASSTVAQRSDWLAEVRALVHSAILA